VRDAERDEQPNGPKSGWIKQANELGLIIVADLFDHERIFVLPYKEELVGLHPHDLVMRGKPAGRDVAADAFRETSAVFARARAARRTDGIIFDRGVADRAREHVGA
jgi:hypothetical protein